MLQIDRQLPAEGAKRAEQLRRLGPRGLVRTAYVRTLGPAVYSLTDTGLETSPHRFIAARRSAVRFHIVFSRTKAP